MAMVVKNNMSAVKTLNTLNKNSAALQKSLAKVSSGMKINSAQDDASGYAISERMRVQIRSLDQANQNTQNASSLMKTAEGAVSSTVEILKSLKEKAINAATDTNTDADRATIQKELDQFIDQIDDNALTTFNGKYLVDGSKGQSGAAVATAFTNQSLEEGTDGSTKLTELANRNGDSLEIESTDSITASFVKNGKTYTTIYKVGDTTLEEVFQNLNTFTDEDGNAVTAFGEGTAPAGAAEDPAVTAARQALNTAKDNLNSIVDTLSNTIQNLNTVTATDKDNSGNSRRGNTWTMDATASNPASHGNDPEAIPSYQEAKSVVEAYLSSLKVDGSTAGSGTLSHSALMATSTSPSHAYTNGILNDSTASYSWNSGGALAGAINAQTSAYSTALTTYNNALTAYNNASSGGGGGGSSSSSSSKALVVNSNQIGTDTFKDPVYTADGTSGVTVTAATAGINGQISGLTLSITDSEGNVKKSANAALDDFRMTIYARNDSSNNELTFQVGAKANQSITVGLDDMRSEALGLKGSDGSKVSVATQDKANAAVSVFDNAIQKALDQQATIGAIEARLEYTSQNLTTSSENVQAAESTIRDADMAKEMTNYTKNNVLLQAAQSMLAQANQNSSAVLSLLQ